MFVEGGLHPIQVEALRKMSLQRRLDLALAAMESMNELRAAMLRSEHPDWSAQRIAQAMRDEVRHVRR